MKTALLAMLILLLPATGALATKGQCSLCDLQIVDVREYREVARYGKVEQPRMRGAVLRIVPKPGLTTAWLLHHLTRESPALAMQGHCPLELATAISVRERGAYFEVQLAAANPATAYQLLRRASALVPY